MKTQFLLFALIAAVCSNAQSPLLQSNSQNLRAFNELKFEKSGLKGIDFKPLLVSEIKLDTLYISQSSQSRDAIKKKTDSIASDIAKVDGQIRNETTTDAEKLQLQKDLTRLKKEKDEMEKKYRL